MPECHSLICADTSGDPASPNDAPMLGLLIGRKNSANVNTPTERPGETARDRNTVKY